MKTNLPAERGQIVALARAFLARFFDNDLTAGSTDLKHSFFWLIAAAAMPGIAMPNSKMEAWPRMAILRAPEGGPEFLRMSASVDIVFAIGVTMITMGLLATVVWNSLLLDRRDALVLGSFPVRHRTVLAGKILALIAFFGIVFAGIHPLAAIFYGLHLGAPIDGIAFGLKLSAVYLLVSILAGLFVVLVVVGAQGLLLSVLGPRLFARVTPTLQMGLVASVVLLFVALPFAATETAGPVYALRPVSRSGVLWMPPVWFFGLYETLLGGTLPVLHVLSERAITALGLASGVALVTYPLAYHRVVNAAVVGTAARQRRPLTARLSAAVPLLLTRDPVSRATIQFAMTTIGRVGLHRLVLAMAAGVALAFIVPIVGSNLAMRPTRPTMGLLAMPIALMVFVLIGLRIALALPADLAANWVFRTSAGSMRREHRSGTRRFLWFAGIAFPLLLSLPALGVLWGPRVFVLHGIVCIAVGVLVVEIAIRRFEGVPCTIPFEPGRAKLQGRWPLYLIGLMTLTVTVPGIEAELLRMRSILGPLIISALMLIVAGGVSYWSSVQPAANESGMEPEPERVGLMLQ
jgi:hypothetical protein